jgi:acyl carrier protein
VSDRIRQIVGEYGGLPVDVGTLADDADLFQAGMTSHASLSVMLALEDAFDTEFPDHMLKRNIFSSVSSIGDALEELGVPTA